MISPLNQAFPVVNKDGTMTDAFRDYMNTLARYLPITGSGSPEGVVNAPLYSLYLDTAGAAGAIEYRKMQTSIGGDTTRGWEQV